MKDYAALARYAETVKRLGAALNYWAALRKEQPDNLEAWHGSISNAMALNETLLAERLITKFQKHFPQQSSRFLYFARLASQKKDFDASLSCWAMLRKLFPHDVSGWAEAALTAADAHDFTTAETLLDEALAQFAEYDAFKTLVQTCSALCTKAAGTAYQTIFREKLTELFRINQENFAVKSKLGIYINNHLVGDFIHPIIKHLPKDSFEIITESTGLYPFSDQTNTYTIKRGSKNLLNYSHVLIDVNFSQWLQERGYKGKIIAYTHATDGVFAPNHAHMAIYSSKRSALQVKNAIARTDLVGLLPDSQAQNISELCYTGPYHIGEYFQKRHMPKKDLQAEAARALNIEIPHDKPFVVMFRDEFCDAKEFARAANAIAEYSTIVVKDLGIKESYRKYLSSSVHVVMGPLAPNLLRFSADILLCGFFSGSFTTSVMLGLPTLPFYSRQCYDRDITFNYKDALLAIDPEHPWIIQILFKKFHDAKKSFDLTDFSAIKEAICGTAYLRWYTENIPRIQQDIFLDYYQDNAAALTAEYIMEFIQKGTLDDKCTACYLR